VAIPYSNHRKLIHLVKWLLGVYINLRTVPWMWGVLWYLPYGKESESGSWTVSLRQ
jgi:hypothetical protein